MDTDLESMPKHQLIAEIIKLRNGIRDHRDSSGHELCWYQPQLWSLLPDKTDRIPSVPQWPQFMRGCIKYRQSLDEQHPDFPRNKKEFDG
jgi:hypothetical protein